MRHFEFRCVSSPTCDNVYAHHIVANGQAPNIQTVDGSNAIDASQIFGETFGTDTVRHRLQNNSNRILHDCACGHHDNDGEYKGAQWVGNFRIWLQNKNHYNLNNCNSTGGTIATYVILDDNGRHKNADALNEIAQYVYHSRLYIDVLRGEVMCMVMVVRTMGVGTVMELLAITGCRRILRTVAMNIVVQRANGRSIENASEHVLVQRRFVVV